MRTYSSTKHTSEGEGLLHMTHRKIRFLCPTPFYTNEQNITCPLSCFLQGSLGQWDSQPGTSKTVFSSLALAINSFLHTQRLAHTPLHIERHSLQSSKSNLVLRFDFKSNLLSNYQQAHTLLPPWRRPCPPCQIQCLPHLSVCSICRVYRSPALLCSKSWLDHSVLFFC